MGETFEDIINLIICDLFRTISDKTKLSHINRLKIAKLFSLSMQNNTLNNDDINTIEIISGKLSIIFGLSENDSFTFIFNLFSDENAYKLNFKLVEMLRNSEITLVKL